MKKFLSMVLALVMTMSLVTVSAGAKDFSDNGKIAYGEAVDVMSAIKVLDGYSDGSFNPQATLTRGAAAKIICNLILGPTSAAALSADTAPFKDVPTNHVFAGYIAYCAQQKIINGYEDHTFRPAATLTSYAFMKMLLGALGYDGKVEGYVGDNWSIAVAKRALGIELNKGLEGSFVGTKPVTREEAALYAFNTLKADMVEYENNFSVSAGDVTVNVGNNQAKAVRWLNSSVKIDSIKNDDYVQFAEQAFPKLVKTSDTDAFMRPTTVWTFEGHKIGEYTDVADKVYTKNTVMADIYADLGLSATNDTFVVYVDGVQAADWDKNDFGKAPYEAADKHHDATWVEIEKGDEDTEIGAGNGAAIYVYKSTEKDVDGIISIVNNYAAEVTGVEAAQGRHAAYVDLAPADSAADAYKDVHAGTSVLVNDYDIDAEGFEVGDIVVINYSFKGNDSVESIKKAEIVKGKVESFRVDKRFTMDGTTYEYGAQKASIFGSEDIASTSVAYLDEYGYAIYVGEGEENIKNYAFVLDAGKDSAVGGASYKAELLYTDGSTKLVVTDQAYGTTGGARPTKDLAGHWVNFKLNSKDEVVLRDLGDKNAPELTAAKASTEIITNNKPAVDFDGDNKVDFRMNSATKIVVKKGDKYTVYDGVKNVPTITTTDGTTKVAYYVDGSAFYAKLVFVDAGNATVKSGTNKVMFLQADKNAKMNETVNDRYYVFDAVVDGKIVEDGVMLDANDAATMNVIVDLVKNGKNVTTSNYNVENEIYTVDTSRDPSIVEVNRDVKKVSGDTYAFDDNAFVMAKDCVFFRIDANDHLKADTMRGLREGTVGTGTRDYYENVTYTLNNSGEVNGVYWEVK